MKPLVILFSIFFSTKTMALGISYFKYLYIIYLQSLPQGLISEIPGLNSDFYLPNYTYEELFLSPDHPQHRNRLDFINVEHVVPASRIANSLVRKFFRQELEAIIIKEDLSINVEELINYLEPLGGELFELTRAIYNRAAFDSDGNLLSFLVLEESKLSSKLKEGAKQKVNITALKELLVNRIRLFNERLPVSEAEITIFIEKLTDTLLLSIVKKIHHDLLLAYFAPYNFRLTDIRANSHRANREPCSPLQSSTECAADVPFLPLGLVCDYGTGCLKEEPLLETGGFLSPTCSLTPRSLVLEGCAKLGVAVLEECGGAGRFEECGGAGRFEECGGAGRFEECGGAGRFKECGGAGRFKECGGAGSLEPALLSLFPKRSLMTSRRLLSFIFNISLNSLKSHTISDRDRSRAEVINMQAGRYLEEVNRLLDEMPVVDKSARTARENFIIQEFKLVNKKFNDQINIENISFGSDLFQSAEQLVLVFSDHYVIESIVQAIEKVKYTDGNYRDYITKMIHTVYAKLNVIFSSKGISISGNKFIASAVSHIISEVVYSYITAPGLFKISSRGEGEKLRKSRIHPANAVRRSLKEIGTSIFTLLGTFHHILSPISRYSYKTVETLLPHVGEGHFSVPFERQGEIARVYLLLYSNHLLELSSDEVERYTRWELSSPRTLSEVWRTEGFIEWLSKHIHYIDDIITKTEEEKTSLRNSAVSRASSLAKRARSLSSSSSSFSTTTVSLFEELTQISSFPMVDGRILLHSASAGSLAPSFPLMSESFSVPPRSRSAVKIDSKRSDSRMGDRKLQKQYCSIDELDIDGLGAEEEDANEEAVVESGWGKMFDREEDEEGDGEQETFAPKMLSPKRHGVVSLSPSPFSDSTQAIAHKFSFSLSPKSGSPVRGAVSQVVFHSLKRIKTANSLTTPPALPRTEGSVVSARANFDASASVADLSRLNFATGEWQSTDRHSAFDIRDVIRAFCSGK